MNKQTLKRTFFQRSHPGIHAYCVWTFSLAVLIKQVTYQADQTRHYVTVLTILLTALKISHINKYSVDLVLVCMFMQIYISNIDMQPQT